MKYLPAVSLTVLAFAAGCHKSPDAPRPQVVSAAPAPPPVTNCQGGTVTWSLPAGNTINSNSSMLFTVPGFDLGCGDSVSVFLRKDSTQTWFQLGNVNHGASYYALSGNVVTVFNMTGIVQEVDIEAVLK